MAGGPEFLRLGWTGSTNQRKAFLFTEMRDQVKKYDVAVIEMTK